MSTRLDRSDAFDEIEAVFLGGGHRLLEEDVLAGVQKEPGRGVVQTVGQGDQHAVHCRPGLPR